MAELVITAAVCNTYMYMYFVYAGYILRDYILLLVLAVFYIAVHVKAVATYEYITSTSLADLSTSICRELKVTEV